MFEYGVDLLWPHLNMMSSETGVHDTMHDLIVDTAGAAIVAAMGYAYMKSGRYSFISDTVHGFIRRNPRLFRRSRKDE
jgi:hypothetical protein